MINNFLYSIAGKKSNNVVDQLLDNFATSEYLPSQEKKIATHCLEVSTHGNYPSAEYFATFYDAPAYTFNTLAELSEYASKVLDFYEKQYLQKKVLSAINDSSTSKDLRTALGDLSYVEETAKASDDSPVFYEVNRPETKGIMCNVPEIDSVTNGFQDGTIVTIGGFTGHGKSTWTNSILFNNALKGKKCLLVSLELTRDLVWHQFEGRYMNQVKGLPVDISDIMQCKLTPELAEQVVSYEADFKRDICDNLIITTDDGFDKKFLTNPQAMSRWLKEKEKKLGGLDLIAFDHVGLFERRFPDCGNQILTAIQNLIKNYHCDDGHQPVCIWCCQANREGNKRARTNPKHVYDLQAIGDLNEVERSSSYVLFLYTESGSCLETRITFAKSRLSKYEPDETIATRFQPEILTVGNITEDVKLEDDFFTRDFSSFDDSAF